MRTLNLGILAHVDAGKTSLTERLLFAAGVIDEIGSVDGGNTQTDTLALERQRGITIKSAVASFVLGDVAVNLIDTPGHPDFIAEVERVLSVLDGAVLVVSAVEGVQAQTRILMRALRRLKIPTLIFVNKIDRRGADGARVIEGIAGKLTPAVVAMGSVRDAGARDADFAPYGVGDAAFTEQLTELLADRDDAILAAYLDDETSVSYGALRAALAMQTARALTHPVFFGSAITGAGADPLIAGLTELLPAAAQDADGAASGIVFKVERGPAGERIAYVRMFSGKVRVRDRQKFGRGKEGKITAIRVFEPGGAVERASLAAGQIGKVFGLGDVRIGDAIGLPRGAGAGEHHFAPPTLETVVLPRSRGDRAALRSALAELAEQDPLINLRQDDVRQELFLSLYGEVQKEVIAETLARDFGVAAEFRETTTICIERPIGIGAALETAPDPFVATVGLRVEPAPVGAGVEFRLEIEFGSLPLSFHKAVEDAVRETLREGLYGWRVTDGRVTMTHAIRLRDFASSTAAEHRRLTPLVVMAALKEAGTVVCEPMHGFRLEIPSDVLGVVLPLLTKLHAVPGTAAMRGPVAVMEGEIPAGRVYELQQKLPQLARGEGVLETAFARYRPVRGAVPIRPRTDHNPLNRKEYLLRVMRRSAMPTAGERG